MTKITASAVQRLAALSAIKLDEDETESISQELTKILEYIDQLGELDTSGVEPTYQVGELTGKLREDEVQVSNIDTQSLLALAAETKDEQIKVPKVL